MIIAFDGNVYTGKTSLIQALAHFDHAGIIQEQGAYITTSASAHTHATEQDAMALQTLYIEAECARVQHIDPAAESYLMDRSFVSMAAHVYALYSLTGIDVREWFVRTITDRIQRREVLIPDIFCFVTCRHDLIKDRFTADATRGTARVYMDEKYLAAIDRFNRKWVARTKGITIDTSTILPIQLAKNLMQQKLILRQEKYEAHRVCDWLREAVMEE